MVRYKSSRQRKAMMAKIRNTEKLMARVRVQIQDDKKLITAGEILKDHPIGKILKTTGRIRLKNDQGHLKYYENRLREIN